MKLRRRYAIVIAKKYGDVIWSIDTNYSRIVEAFKKYKKLNPEVNCWIQEIIT